MAKDKADGQPVLLWVWEHYRLCVYDCDTLDGAAGMAEAFLDSGHGSAAGAEVRFPDGGVEWVGSDVLTEIVDNRPLPAPGPPIVASIFIDPPKEALDTARGQLAPDWQDDHSSYSDRAEAQAEYEVLRQTWGDRVRLVDV